MSAFAPYSSLDHFTELNNFEHRSQPQGSKSGSSKFQQIRLVDDGDLRGEWLRNWLDQHWSIHNFDTVTSETANGQDADLIIISDGMDLDKQLDALLAFDRKEVPIVVFCMLPARAVAERWLELGVRGVIPYDLPAELAVRALDYVLAGGRFVPCDLLEPTTKKSSAARNLTPRELDVAGLLVKGLPNKLIAHKLSLSEATVKVYVRSILGKLGCHNRTEAAHRLAGHDD